VVKTSSSLRFHHVIAGRAVPSAECTQRMAQRPGSALA
jgi:hypothetical protein